MVKNLQKFIAPFDTGYRITRKRRIFVVSSAVKLSSSAGFAHATPLLKKERDLLRFALCSNASHPSWQHGPCTWTAFSADNHPINIAQAEIAQIFQKGFNREKCHFRFRATKQVNSRQTMFAVLHA